MKSVLPRMQFLPNNNLRLNCLIKCVVVVERIGCLKIVGTWSTPKILFFKKQRNTVLTNGYRGLFPQGKAIGA
jgi:hypothetical protein